MKPPPTRLKVQSSISGMVRATLAENRCRDALKQPPLPAIKRRKSIGGPWKRGSINSKRRDDTDHDQNEEDGSKAEGNFIFLDEVHRVFLQDSKNEATKKPKKTIFHFGGIRRSERSVQSAKKDSLFPISNWVNDS